MSKPNVDMKKLAQQADTLTSLIRDTNGILNQTTSLPPLSDMARSLEKTFSHAAPKLAVQAQKAMRRGKPEEILLLPLVVVGVWAAEIAIDEAGHQIARAKARKALLGYYQELASKQNIIIEELNRISQELAAAMRHQENRTEEFARKLALYESRYNELVELMNRFNALKKNVEK